MKIREFTALYEAYCPKDLAMEGDPVGLQVGSLDKEVKKVLVTLDIREQTVSEAIEQGVDMIVAKHPIIFRPLANLTDEDNQEKLVLDLVRADIAVYISHTNIDIVSDGLNDWFCDLLGITETSYLVETKEGYGIGRIGNVKKQTLKDFTEKFKSVFDMERLRLITYDHSLNQKISQVAICGGSGGKFWTDALSKGADLYITADVYYHTGHDMLSTSLIGLDPGHYLEHLFVPKVAEKLKSFDTNVEIIESKANTNPFYDI